MNTNKGIVFMKTIKLISFLQIIAILALIFAGCGKSETPPPPVEENPDFTLTESGEKLPFYSDGVFNFNIITPVEDNESYDFGKVLDSHLGDTISVKFTRDIIDE